MARLLFGTRPELGLIVLPAMLYHQVQLLVCASLARRYARAMAASGAEQRDMKLAGG
jgi:sodium/bile acid cotransporter 7